MKSPREVLLSRHEQTNAKLDKIRLDVVDQLRRHPAPGRSFSHWSQVFRQVLLRELCWSNPRAWAGLGAAWVLIFALKLATPAPHQFARTNSTVSPESLAKAREQRLFFAELLGAIAPSEAVPAKPPVPTPRSAGPGFNG